MLQDLQPTCYGIVSTFFAISTITIVLRIYSRGFLLKSLGWDDWCMLTIFFFNCGQQAILYYFLHFGGGLHTASVLETHPEWLEKLTYALFAEEIYYVWMHFVIKMAFLLFYLRFATKTFRKLVFCTIGVNVLFTLSQWLLYCFQCMPLDAFFNHAAYPTVKCLDNSILAFVPAALSIFTDVCIVILPIQPLWNIRASLRKRIELISIVSLGGIVVIISILRLIVLLEFQKMTDFTYSLGKIIIISCVELEVAIIAANAPALKVLILDVLGNTSKSAEVENSPDDGTHSLSNLKMRHVRTGYAFDISGNFTRNKAGGRESIAFRDDCSEEALTGGMLKDSIVVTSTIGVETRDARSSHARGIRAHSPFGTI